ncbi:hypothetical protein [Cylindrospermopsis raciborskii]|uniref:hypothetical protein n=1 Tax=Cylindrospermopsis raciborskii TaxID=77022 RepID=UPI0015C4CDCA|nr:hypothetical protein [Cylindrospermopsis raciborskii]
MCLLLLALSFPLFIISTTSRQLKSVTSDTTNLEEQFIQTIELSGSAFRSQSLVSILAPSFSRASFLDTSLDLIKNCNNYRQIINPIFYSKSIIDNALTPGAVDFFDTPKAANALISIYGNISNISLRSTRISYQSDQMNIYGEFFVLFYGWFSMPAFFLFTYFFQVIFFHNLNREKFDYGRSVLDIFWMNVFFSVLISFGIDWIIGETIQSYITTRMMLFFIKTRIRL